MKLKKISSDKVYEGRVFDVIVDQVQYPSGAKGIREVVHHPGGAAVVALLEDQRVLLVRQMRYPFQERVLELPAGKLDPGEDPAAAAARELQEETGWAAGTLEKLTAIYPSPGFCDEVVHLYLARNLTRVQSTHTQEEGEMDIVVEEMALDAAIAKIPTGEIRDGKTIIGLLLMKNFGF